MTSKQGTTGSKGTNEPTMKTNVDMEKDKEKEKMMETNMPKTGMTDPKMGQMGYMEGGKPGMMGTETKTGMMGTTSDPKMSTGSDPNKMGMMGSDPKYGMMGTTNDPKMSTGSDPNKMGMMGTDPKHGMMGSG